MTAAVLLNYNDADTTIAAVRRIASFSCLDHIVIVDNASTDGSAEKISEAFAIEPQEMPAGENDDKADGRQGCPYSGDKSGERIFLLRSDRNGGYGYGNNLGVRWAAEHLGADLVLIANPDAVFSEELVRSMQACFALRPKVGAVGALMAGAPEPELSYDEFIRAGWRERGFWGELLHSGPVCKRLFRQQLNYPPEYYKKTAGTAGGDAIEVFAVHGSLLMVSSEAFLGCGGYDEAMFLYMEEYVLGQRMKACGFRTLLLLSGYTHEGSHSITGAGWKAVARQRFRQDSERIYYRKYLHAGSGKMLAAGIFQHLVMLETKIYGLLNKS